MLTPAARRRNLIAVTAAMAVASLIYGMTSPLLALTLDAWGVEDWLVGLNAAVGSAAVFPAVPLASWLMRRFGTARPILVGLLLTAVVWLLLPAMPNLGAWFGLRFLMGIGGSIVWMVGEAWINQVAEDHNRGRLVGLYSMATGAGFSIGPLVLSSIGTSGWWPFVAAAGFTLVSILPVLSALRSAPPFAPTETSRVYRYVLDAPVAFFICGAVALADGALLTFLPIYGLRVGLDEATGLSLITAFGLGGLACQLPVGWLADRMNRRLLAFLASLGLVAATLLVPALAPHEPWNWLHFFVYGGLMMGLYTIGMVLRGEQYRDAALAAASATFGAMWGLGTLLGPLLGGIGMRTMGHDGLVVLIAFVFVAFLPLPAIGYLRRGRA